MRFVVIAVPLLSVSRKDCKDMLQVPLYVTRIALLDSVFPIVSSQHLTMFC